MQEFSSISVSSYEPGTLADRLNERAADGWAVVAIVTTGSTVTAYINRERTGSASSATSSAVQAPSEPSPVADVTPAPAASTAGHTPEVDQTTPTETDAGMGASAAAIEPVDEPGGWAVTPESTSTGSATSAAPSSATISPELPSRGSGLGDSGSTVASTTSTAGSASASAAAPAGWYADPSSRYELRYWDGSQWTEHVSRAGQQFTDPPVA